MKYELKIEFKEKDQKQGKSNKNIPTGLSSLAKKTYGLKKLGKNLIIVKLTSVNLIPESFFIIKLSYPIIVLIYYIVLYCYYYIFNFSC